MKINPVERDQNEQKEKKKLVDNFLWLSILQAANYILPLITLPYLVRILGPQKFGLIAFAQAFIQYFIVLTDYGFNLSATREISLNRDNLEKVSQIFSSVMIIKMFLLALSLLILFFITAGFDKINRNAEIYFLTFGMVIGNVLFPVWFFQGIEKMRYITLFNIIAKLIFTISIFVFIDEALDYIYVPLINSFGFIVAGVLGFGVALRKFQVRLKLPTLDLIKSQLKEGWHIFISTLGVSSYRIFPTAILGIFYNYELVGFYKVGEQLIRALVSLLQPLTQSLFPFISKMINQSLQKGIEFSFSVLRKLSVMTLLLSAIVFLFANTIIYYFAGENYHQSVTVLKILAVLPFIVGIANILGVQIMLNINLKREFSYILVSCGILSLILLFILVPLFSIIGATISVLVTESIVMLAMGFVVYRKLSEIKFSVKPISSDIL